MIIVVHLYRSFNFTKEKKVNMIMPISLLKGFVDLSIGALRSQIDILEELGYSRTRRPFIQRLQLQTGHLLKLVESAEDHQINYIQSTMDEVIGTTAQMRNLVNKESAKTCDPVLKHIAELTVKTHDETVKRTGKIETEITKEITAEIADMKKDIKKLLEEIGNLRIS